MTHEFEAVRCRVVVRERAGERHDVPQLSPSNAQTQTPERLNPRLLPCTPETQQNNRTTRAAPRLRLAAAASPWESCTKTSARAGPRGSSSRRQRATEARARRTSPTCPRRRRAAP